MVGVGVVVQVGVKKRVFVGVGVAVGMKKIVSVRVGVPVSMCDWEGPTLGDKFVDLLDAVTVGVNPPIDGIFVVDIGVRFDGTPPGPGYPPLLVGAPTGVDPASG